MRRLPVTDHGGAGIVEDRGMEDTLTLSTVAPPLPACRHRGSQIAGTQRFPCHSPRVICSADGVSARTCATCYLCDHDDRPAAAQSRQLNQQFNQRPPSPTVHLADLECIYRGERMQGVHVPCRTCASVKGAPRQVQLYQCSKLGACTLGLEVQGVACCNGCTERVPPRPNRIAGERPTVRNLIYHLYPFRGNGVWEWNVRQLVSRIGQFNGKRVVGLALDDSTATEADVRAAFGESAAGITFLTVQNNPGLREVTTFDGLFSAVQSLDVHEATFYAHNKGVRHGMTADRGTTCTDWAQVMYESCLDYPEHVADVLSRHPCAGTFKKVGHGFQGSASAWHYTGSFFWFRNADLFWRNWRHIDRCWYGIEPYLSLHFGAGDAGCLFLDGIVGVCNDGNREHAMRNRHLDCYDWRYFQEHVKPTWEQWKLEHAHLLSTTAQASA